LQGRLFGKVTATALRYSDDKVTISVEHAMLNWRPLVLLRGKISVKEFYAQHLSIEQLSSSALSSSSSASLAPQAHQTQASRDKITMHFNWPWLPTISVRKLHITDLSLKTAQKRLFVFESLTLPQLQISDKIALHDLLITHEHATLSANGEITPRWPYPSNLQWQLQGRHKPLQQFKLAGELRGDLEKLTLSSHSTAPLEHQLTADIKHLQTVPTFEVKGQWKNVAWPLAHPQWMLPSGNINLKGSLEDYRFTVNTDIIKAPWPKSLFVAQGHGDRKALTVSELSLGNGSNNIKGNGALQFSPALHWHAKWQLSVNDLPQLLPNMTGKISSQGHAKGDLKTAELAASLNLQQLKSLHSPAAFSGEWRIEAHTDQQKKTAHFSLQKGHIDFRQYGKTHTWPIKQADLQATLSAQGMKTEVKIHMPTQKRLTASLAIPEWKTLHLPKKEHAIKGALTLHFDALDILPLFVPELSETRGLMNASFNVSGTVGKPRFTGQLAVNAEHLRIPRLGINIKPVQLQGHFKENNALHFEGKLSSGKGHITATGQWQPLNPQQPLKVHLQGKQFTLANIPEYKVILSPDIKITMQPGKLNVDGDINIDEADLKPKDFSKSVELPEETIIVRKNAGEKEKAAKKKAEKKKRIAIHTRIQLKLGNKTFISAKGLKGELRGQIEIIEEPNHPTRASGELRIEKGRFQAYGQDLAIMAGQLHFANSPINNPQVHLQAGKTFTRHDTTQPFRFFGASNPSSIHEKKDNGRRSGKRRIKTC